VQNSVLALVFLGAFACGFAGMVAFSVPRLVPSRGIEIRDVEGQCGRPGSFFRSDYAGSASCPRGAPSAVLPQ